MYLPEDLARQILLKLRSTKSAVRLSSVCKSWRDLIFKDPDFGAKFFNKKDDPILLFHRHKHSDDQHEYQIRTRNSHVSLGFPEKVIPVNLKEIGSCNGILCLQETIPDDWYRPQANTQVNLYNPITREFRKIPHLCVDVLGYGFGYDSTTRDYKVIRIKKQNMAEIYKFSTNCWSKLEVKQSCFYDRSWFCDSFVYAKGCCYWRSYLDVCFSVIQDSSVRFCANSGACWVEDTTLFQLKPDGKVTTFERRGIRGSKFRLFRFDSPLNSMTFKPSLVSLGSNCFVPAPRY